MTTLLPQDTNDNPIPALRLKQGGAHTITVTSTSARNATAFDNETQIISLYATTGVYIKFGNSSVTATSADHYFPEGIYYDIAIGGENSAHYTHIGVLRVDTDGMLYISEKE